MDGVVYVKEDLVKVRRDEDKEKITLAWGDPVGVLGYANRRTQVRVFGRDSEPFTGTVRGRLPTQPRSILKFALVDVQQGDGMVLETPKGRILFIDGGDNKLFARYTANRYRGTSAAKPLRPEALIVTHGDADHYKGLTEIVKSESHKTPRKRLFLHPKRVYHNGLVKGPSKLSPEKIFGETVDLSGGRAVVELEGDLRNVPRERLNRPFRRWVKTLKHWSDRGPIEVRRVSSGEKEAFEFLVEEGIRIDVLGPIVQRVTHNGKKTDALPLLRRPPKAEEAIRRRKPKSFSTAHTINGHSIVLKIQLGNVRLLLTGDLNRESMKTLREEFPNDELQAEVVKVPHHGSADFDRDSLKAFSPVVWLISSGDESSRTEYIHPRANLMGALGWAARGDETLVFCTELAAFFAVKGMSTAWKTRETYFGFKRKSFGIIHVRTDGERVLVFTHSGKENLKEAYRFSVDNQHRVSFANIRMR